MVDPAVVCLSRAGNVPGLFNLGGFPGEPLLAGSKWGELPFPVLLAGTVWGFAARDFRAEAGLVAGLAFVFASSLSALGASRVPAHLLLLPRRILQGVLGGPASLCSG